MSDEQIGMAVKGKLSAEEVNLLVQQFTALQQAIYVSNVKLAAMTQESNRIVQLLKEHQQVEKDATNE